MGTDDGWQPKLRIGNIAKVISVTKCNTVLTSVKNVTQRNTGSVTTKSVTVWCVGYRKPPAH